MRKNKKIKIISPVDCGNVCFPLLIILSQGIILLWQVRVNVFLCCFTAGVCTGNHTLGLVCFLSHNGEILKAQSWNCILYTALTW